MRSALDRVRGRTPTADETQEIRLEPAPDAPRLAGGAWTRMLGPRSPAPVYAGLVLIAAGFGLVAYTWSRMAGMLAVSLQLPYLASGGLTAVALVAVGTALVSLAVARRDAARREERLEELAEALRAITEALRAIAEAVEREPGRRR